MKRILFFGIIVLVLAGVVACSVTSSGVVPPFSHVYIAGQIAPVYIGAPTLTVPVVWKDGTLTPLPLASPMTNGWVSGAPVVDSKGNVYVLGGEWNQGGPQSTAGYWKNSTFVAIGPSSSVGLGNIAVDTGGNVWILGSLNSIPTYWYNGTPTAEPTVTGISGFNSFKADGSGNVYLMLETNANTAEYMIGTAGKYVSLTPTALPLLGGNTTSYTGDMSVDTQGNVYVTGSQWPASGSNVNMGPCYWKAAPGGSFQATLLPISTTYPQASYWANSSTAAGPYGNVDVAAKWGPYPPGGAATSLVYWIGVTGAPTAMTLPSGDALTWLGSGCSTFDSSGNFITVGQAGNTYSGGQGSWLTDGVPVYWTNATPTLLKMSSGNTWGIAQGVVVAP